MMGMAKNEARCGQLHLCSTPAPVAEAHAADAEDYTESDDEGADGYRRTSCKKQQLPVEAVGDAIAVSMRSCLRKGRLPPGACRRDLQRAVPCLSETWMGTFLHRVALPGEEG